MEKENYNIPILKEYDKQNHTLESEEEGTPPKEKKPARLNKKPNKDFLASSHFFTRLIIIMIVCFILTIIFLLLSFKDGQECMSNPFVYGAKEVITEHSQGLSCTCYFANPTYAPFYFNNEELVIGIP